MPSFSILSASNNTFRNQRPDEKTILVVRKHWITLFGPMVFLIFFALLPFIASYFIYQVSWYDTITDLYWFIITVYFLILWVIFFGNLMIYSLNVIIVTNQRIIENHQQGLFKHTLNEMRLDKVQDITVEMNGVLANILNFGNILIQSAGTQNEFYFTKIPHPDKVKKTIMDARNECGSL
ncbi:MAG: PH domain-containing protein [Candidatus Pacebacteria bacterium]|nr:PH domain-containing protein [Candidatus Paceibacterota bacterium]